MGLLVTVQYEPLLGRALPSLYLHVMDNSCNAAKRTATRVTCSGSKVGIRLSLADYDIYLWIDLHMCPQYSRVSLKIGPE